MSVSICDCIYQWLNTQQIEKLQLMENYCFCSTLFRVFVLCSLTLSAKLVSLFVLCNICTETFFFFIFVGPRSILWCHWCPCFGFHVTLPMGFRARVSLRVMSDATSAFSTNRGVHCASMYTAGLPSRHPSCKQRIANFGAFPSTGNPWISLEQNIRPLPIMV